jgi:hypothetical protein
MEKNGSWKPYRNAAIGETISEAVKEGACNRD